MNTTTTNRTYICPFCGDTATESAAIEAEWAPSFWYEACNAQRDTPVCAACVENVLEYSEEHSDFYLPATSAQSL